MDYTPEDVISEVEHLNTSQLLLLSIINCEPAKITRILKLGLIVERILDIGLDTYGPYNYGGFSDKISEASRKMKSHGVVEVDANGNYALTDYGSDVLKKASENDDNSILINHTPPIVEFLSTISDSDLKELTYLLYPDTIDRSLIKGDMDLISSERRYSDASVYLNLTREQMIQMLIQNKKSVKVLETLRDGASVLLPRGGNTAVMVTLSKDHYIVVKRVIKLD